MLRVSRKRRGPDPTLGYRMALFALGAVAGLTGMATERSWLVTIGTIFLAAGLLIAIVQHREREKSDPSANDDPPEDP